MAELLRSAGITFTVYGDDAGVERTFPMDLLPRIIPAAEWAHVEAGVIQREAFGIPVPHAGRCLVSGVDIVRDEDGRYVVLEDSLRDPSGISYVLENRAAMTRVLPLAFAEQRVRPVDHYGPVLLQALQEVAPPAAGEHPRAVVLTPGVHNSAYFEHVFLTRQMGIDEVEVETHAWVEAAIAGWGWLALDPTNAQAVSERHVSIGRGRDYDDVPPFRGVFIGDQRHELDVSVTMRRLAFAPLGDARLGQGAQQQ
ncbi:MAG: circularly permuted type 2 ATP-grasp protein [Nitriliruptoraceae bacterium]